MNRSFLQKISDLSPKQKTGLLLGVLLVLLVPSILVVQKGQTDTRSRAAGTGEVAITFDVNGATYNPGSTFTAGIQMELAPSVTRSIAISGAQAIIDVPSSVFTINPANTKCVAPFDGTPFVSINGTRVTLFCAIAPGANPPVMTANPAMFGSISLTVLSTAPLGNATLPFVATRATEAGISGQSPDVSTAGTTGVVTIAATSVPSLTPTLTPTSTLSPTPTAGPTATPPANVSDYLINIGTKDSLTLNIGPGNFLLVNFKAKLADVEKTPDLLVRMRVRDELAFTQNPPATADTCQSPGTGSRDFYIPVRADANGVYSPTSAWSATPSAGMTLAVVESNGWVELPGLVADRYYSFSLKGPKTRGTKMVDHFKLTTGTPASQNFDWTTNELLPGDLPNPNSNGKQDCTVNSIDLSLLIDRQGKTDQDSINVADVNYDGVVNGNDIAQVVNTLSTKPDDE